MRRMGGLVLAALMAATAGHAALATPTPPPIRVDLTISFLPSPPPIIPDGALLTGVATFYKDFGGLDLPPVAVPPNPIDIGDLGAGGSFHVVFSPGDPCFGAGLCGLDFSFAGLTGAFPTFAFPALGDLPNAGPNPPPILPI